MKKSFVLFLGMMLLALVSCGKQVAPVENVETPVVPETPVSEEPNIPVEEPVAPGITFEDDNFVVQDGELYFKKKTAVQYQFVKMERNANGVDFDIVDKMMVDSYQTTPPEGYTHFPYGTGIVLEKIETAHADTFASFKDFEPVYAGLERTDGENVDPLTGQSGTVKERIGEDQNNVYFQIVKTYPGVTDAQGAGGETELVIVKK